MKTNFNSILLSAVFCGLSATALANGTVPPEPTPFICDGEAYTVRNTPGEFYQIDQSVSPFTFNQIGGVLTGPFGTNGALVPIQVNNIGYRLVDNLIYGVALKVPTTFDLNFGLIKIDSLGQVFPVSTSPEIANIDKRFLAGDVDPDKDIMYLNTYPTSNPMYVVDLSSATPTVTEKSLVNTNNVYVADWAVNPTNGKLYGADARCKVDSSDVHIFELDPDSGVITNMGTVAGLACSNSGDSQYFGGSWFNALGNLFIYRNNDLIYEINLSDLSVVSDQTGGAGSSQFNDATACAAGVPIVDKFYTYTNNNWSLRCEQYEEDKCVSYRLPNINLDDDIFAAPLPQDNQGAYVLLGKQLKKKTVINPGQYFAVSNVYVPKEQDILIKEDFSDCLDIGTVNPASVPGGVQVVLTTSDGNVHELSGDLAQGIGGSIQYDFNAGTVLVLAENVPAESVLRVMVKFQPSNALGIIGMSCTNHEIALDPIDQQHEITRDSETLVIKAK